MASRKTSYHRIEIIANHLNGHTILTKIYISVTQNPNRIQELNI